jgi:putative ABC transport system permease protein
MADSWIAVFRALVWRPFWRGGLRSAFVILGVALGVAITAAINLANHSALATFRESLDLVSGRTHVQILPAAQVLPETILLRLGWLRRLGEVSPVVEGTVGVAGQPMALRLLGLDLLHADIPVTGGTPVGRSDKPVVLHPALAARLHLRPGMTLTLLANDRPVTVTITALLPAEGRTSSWGQELLLTDIAVAQDVLRRPGELDRLDVRLADPEQASEVLAALEMNLPPVARPVTPERRNAQVGRMLRAFQANLAALSYIALLVGAYLIYNTLSVSVVQRRTEIGTLRALGVSRELVFLAITAEAVLIGTVGSLLGLGGGLLLARGAVGAVSQTVNSLYVSTGPAAVHYDPWTLVLSAGVGLALSVLAAAVPAWEASRTSPAVAMRRGTWGMKQHSRIGALTLLGLVMLAGAWLAALQPPIGDMPVFGFLAAMLVVVGASFLVPLLLVVLSRIGRRFVGMRLGFAARMATVNLGASVGRHAVAVASLMVGLAMILSVAIMIGSFRTTVETWVNQTLRADLYVRPAFRGAQGGALLSPSTLQRLSALPGVVAVGPYREFSVVIGDRPTKIGSGDLRFTERFAPMRFVDSSRTLPDVAPRLIGQDRVIVSETFAVHFGIQAGDALTVPTPHGPVRMPIEGVYYDYANEQGIVIMDRTTLLKHFGDPRLTSISLAVRTPADADRVRQAIETDRDLSRSVAVTSSGELRREAMRIFDETFAITYALQVIAMTVALLGVVATLVTLVLERQGEIAVLRAVGITRQQVAAMVVAESAGMGVAGCIVGTGAGFALALLLIKVINKQSFGWTIQWQSPWRHVVVSAVLVMVTALLAGIYPGWRATRTTVSEALRAE